MNEFMKDFIKRNLPQFEDNFDVIITNEKEEKYKRRDVEISYREYHPGAEKKGCIPCRNCGRC